MAIEELEKPEALIEEDKQTKKKKKKKKRENVNVTIETVSEKPDKVSPIVGYFPSGYEPAGSETQVKVLRHERKTNRLQLVVTPNGSQVDFVGTNFSGEAATPQVCTYALGVLDKENQTLKIVPIASNKIFRLDPKFRGADEPVDEENEELTAEPKAKSVMDLTAYSTKKDIRRAKKAFSQKEDPNTQEDLDRKIKEMEINKEALEIGGSSHSARNIPPHDSTATTPQMAYPVDKIILKGEWDFLLDILELSQDGGEIQPDTFPSYVCNRVHRLENIEDEMERQKLACIFSFINHLIKYKEKFQNPATAKHHSIPNILLQRFSSTFVETEEKKLSDEKMDLLVSYVLVLTLIVDDFRTNISDIGKDLKMASTKLRTYYEHLGCNIGRDKDGRGPVFATLSAPLQFPKPRGKRKR